MAPPSHEGAPNVSQSPEGYGLGISGPRLQGGWPEAQSGSSMFPIGKAAGGNQFQMPQYALTPPSGGNADVAGIQQAMERFKKMGTDMTESKLRNLAAKYAAQDNSLDSRSATGEGKGLTYKTNDDDHATGTAAWDSLSQYMKKADATISAAQLALILGGSFVGGKLGPKTMRNLPSLVRKYLQSSATAGGPKASGGGKTRHLPAWGGGRRRAGPLSKTDIIAEAALQGVGGAVGGVTSGIAGYELSKALDGSAKTANDLEKEAWVGPAISAAARVGSRVLPWARTALGWGAKGGKAAVQGGKAMAQGVSKVPGMYRAGGGGVKGVAAGGKQLSRSVLGRAPGKAGRYASGTGVRGLVGRHPMESMLTVGTLGMGGGGGGGEQSPQAQGGPGGGGYGPGGGGYGTGGGGGGYQPGQQDQWNPDWEQTTQPVGHTPKEAAMNIKAACDATGLTPYQLTFAARVHEADLSPQQIEEGINKAGEYMGEEYVEELREGMDKIASMDKEALGALLRPLLAAGLKAVPKGGRLLKGLKGLKGVVPGGAKALPTYTSRSGRSPMGGMLPKGMSISTPGAARVGGGKLGQGDLTANLANKLFKSNTLAPGNATRAIKGIGGWGGAVRMAGGAMTGDMAAGEDAPWYVKYPMMAGGAAFGRAMPNMGAGARAAGGRAVTGGFTGLVGDQAAGLAGIDTGGRFSQLGALGGFASPLMKGQKIPGARRAGLALRSAGGRPLEGARQAMSKARLPDLSPGGAISQRGVATAEKYLGKPGYGRTAKELGLYSSPAIAGAGIAGVGGAIDSKVEEARQKSMQEVMNDPKIQNALQMAEQGGGFMDSLSGMANVIDPILKLIGIDPSQMNPMMKVLLMAGGGLGIGGLLSGSKGAGMGGLATMAVPLIAQYMKKQQQGGGAPSAPSGLDQAVGQEDARFTAQERAFFDSLPQGHQDAFNAMSPEEQSSALEEYRGEQTELEKATG